MVDAFLIFVLDSLGVARSLFASAVSWCWWVDERSRWAILSMAERCLPPPVSRARPWKGHDHLPHHCLLGPKPLDQKLNMTLNYPQTKAVARGNPVHLEGDSWMCCYKERRNPDSGTSKTSCAQPPALRVSWAVRVGACRAGRRERTLQGNWVYNAASNGTKVSLGCRCTCYWRITNWEGSMERQFLAGWWGCCVPERYCPGAVTIQGTVPWHYHTVVMNGLRQW